jgi:hypothetical protein
VQHVAKGVKHLGAHPQRLGKARRTDGQHHELLEVDPVLGVRAAVQDVHHRQRQKRVVLAEQPAVQRHPRRLCRGVRGGEGGAEQRVGTEPGLVAGSVELDQAPVERRLLAEAADVEAPQRARDLAQHVPDRPSHALAAVALLAIAQLQRFAAAGRRPGRHRRAAALARVEQDFDLDGRVAARVKDLARSESLDSTHRIAQCTRSAIARRRSAGALPGRS